MPRRRPFGVRHSFTRPARRSILVVIGAERTETAYLKGLARRFRLSAVTMDVVEKPGAPDQLVTYARDVYGSEGYGQIWCVTDVDHYEREGGKVTVAVAAKSGVELAVSNPCFELWLLLHHAACSGFCANCGAVEKKLKRSLPAYNKTRLRFEDFADGLDDAIARAKLLEPTGSDHALNPSTSVWRLVGALLEKE